MAEVNRHKARATLLQHLNLLEKRRAFYQFHMEMLPIAYDYYPEKRLKLMFTWLYGSFIVALYDWQINLCKKRADHIQEKQHAKH
jgi:hypothetical protein